LQVEAQPRTRCVFGRLARQRVSRVNMPKMLFGLKMRMLKSAHRTHKSLFFVGQKHASHLRARPNP